MKFTIAILLLLPGLALFSQKTPTEKAKPIVEEGKRLYQSEITSWYGTDLFIENYKGNINPDGYFSYADKYGSKCVFYSGSEKPRVIGTISFDKTVSPETGKVDFTARDFTKLESDFYTIRENALKAMDGDTLFKIYEDMNLNLVPLITKKEKKVYVLTGPIKNGVVVFGNDYLLTFDKKNKLLSEKQLHANIIPIEYNKKDPENPSSTIHTHLPETGDFITATDICTLMLYEKFAGWEQHLVVSKNYINIWNCKEDSLIVLPKEMFENSEDGAEPEKKNSTKNED